METVHPAESRKVMNDKNGVDGPAPYTETRYGQDKDPQDIGDLHRQLKAR